jgi:hypothetical protein
MPGFGLADIRQRLRDRTATRGAFALLALSMALLVGACASAPLPTPTAQAPPDDVRIASLASSSEFTTLGGISSAAVKRLLGEPDLRRQEPPAEIWQYRSADCVLEVFLYRDQGQYRVAYAETHDRGLVRVSQSSCYVSIVAARDRARPSRF